MSAADSLSVSNPPAGCGALYAGTNSDHARTLQTFNLKGLAAATRKDAVRRACGTGAYRLNRNRHHGTAQVCVEWSRDSSSPVPANPAQAGRAAAAERLCDSGPSAVDRHSTGLAAHPIPRGPQYLRGSPGAVVLSPAPGLL